MITCSVNYKAPLHKCIPNASSLEFNRKGRASSVVMAGFVHGLSVHGPSVVATKKMGEMFSRRLSEDLTCLITWVNENPKRNLLTAVVAEPTWDYRLITALRTLGRTCYIIVWHSDATEDGIARIQAFQSGANMVTNNPEHLHEALQRVTSIHGNGDLSCPWCGLGGFSEHELWRHQPLYHIYEVRDGGANFWAIIPAFIACGVLVLLQMFNVFCVVATRTRKSTQALRVPPTGKKASTTANNGALIPEPLTSPRPNLNHPIVQPDKLDSPCPACHKRTSRLTRHINLYHGPTQLVDERTGVFALAVVRRPEDGKFLMVQERYGEGYWLPGGGVDTGESLRQGAMREAWEEAGADIVVTGILTVESLHRGLWRRVIFLAEPVPFLANRDNGGEAAADPALTISDTDPAAVRAASSFAAADAAGSLRHRYRCKTLPDVESAGACWVAVEELEALPLRSTSEPLTWIPWVANGGRVLPLNPEAVPEVARTFPDFQL
ncbi:hypothetical protein Vretimale_12727 [Volvox reticuliferus]|uniref:Nudix hydrolase domain-containing protein n=1 Tax=Volvox reticuliferus TaxID=1737510 RepID=A0A8J4GK40_9CHLO|nr:hypothetical protein Vretifemale_20844 [Volvox reticuliferus]GIM08735.1 hypothetical protein Vretimale_12727 [Volvox reticuliferus]